MKKVVLMLCCAINIFSSDFELTFSRRQQECMNKIFYSLAEKNAASLLINALSLKSMGKEIDPVPPLEVLYYVMQNPKLKNYLRKTRKRYFQWNAFITGFAEKCNRKDVYPNIEQRIEDFSYATHQNEEILKAYVASRNWQGLVEYLIKKERR